MKLRNTFLAAGMTALIAMAALQPTTASASEPSYADPSYSDAVYSFAIVSGIDVVEDSTDGYLGLIAALNRDLDSNGFLFRILGSMGSYQYESGALDFDGDYWQGDVMIGYQIVSNGVSVAAFVGVDHQDHEISPVDIGNPLQGSETGFKVALDIETERYAKSPIYAALRGAYSTSFDTYYVLGRLGMNFGKLTIGPEGMILGDVSGDAHRLGGFLMFDMQLGPATVANLAFSVGYQFVDNAEDPLGRNFGSEGVYGTVKYSIAFGEVRTPLK